MPLTVSKMFAIVLLLRVRLEYGESQDAYILLGTRNVPPDPKNRNENERKERNGRRMQLHGLSMEVRYSILHTGGLVLFRTSGMNVLCFFELEMVFSLSFFFLLVAPVISD